MAVPVHNRHGIARLHPGLCQHIGKPSNALAEGAVVETQLIAIDDFAGALVALPRQQQALDQQGVLVGIRGGFDHSCLQHKASCY